MAAKGGGAALKRFEVVVWGATGFVGRLTTRYLYQFGGESLKWAIAGRTREKVQRVMDDARAAVGSAVQAPDPEVLTASLDDDESLDAICQSTKVVCALVGPYALHGEPMLAACVRNGTGYVDITGESGNFVGPMIEKYDAAARASGAVVVNCCGYDSVPSDVGTFALVDHVRKTFGTSTEQVRAVQQMDGAPSGGTMLSMLTLLERPGDLDEVLNPLALCEEEDKGVNVAGDGDDIPFDLVRDVFPQHYAVPFIMAVVNTRVVRRSAGLFAQQGSTMRYSSEKEPFSYRECSVTRSSLSAYSAAIGSFLQPVGLLCCRIPGCVDLAKSLVVQPGDGPSDERRAASFFRTTLVATPRKKDDTTPERVVLTISGGDPGYDETAKFVAESALAIARDDIPGKKGGILTPAVAFQHILPQRLQERGIHFEFH